MSTASSRERTFADKRVVNALRESLELECQARERLVAAADGIRDPQLRIECERFLAAQAHWQKALRERIKPFFVEELLTCLAEPEQEHGKKT